MQPEDFSEEDLPTSQGSDESWHPHQPAPPVPSPRQTSEAGPSTVPEVVDLEDNEGQKLAYATKFHTPSPAMACFTVAGMFYSSYKISASFLVTN